MTSARVRAVLTARAALAAAREVAEAADDRGAGDSEAVAAARDLLCYTMAGLRIDDRRDLDELDRTTPIPEVPR